MILDQIVKKKKAELASDQSQEPLAELKSKIVDLPPTRDFAAALTTSNGRNQGVISLIAELKKKSPSKGIIRQQFDLVEITQAYANNGASAISVLTDEHFFGGHLNNLQKVRTITQLPLLRKDFTIAPYHLYQARLAGADAILLIVAILSLAQIREYLDLAHQLGLAALVEVHTEREMEIALQAEAEIIGINNRDLTIFETDLNTTFRLKEKCPENKIIVSESGIRDHSDVLKLQSAGIDAILVGESLMISKDIGTKVKSLLGKKNPNTT